MLAHKFATVIVGLAICLRPGCAQTEFGAASVRAVEPGDLMRQAPAGGPGSSSPGRFTARTFLIELLETAYGLPEDRISGGPPWLRPGSGGGLYEVEATVPPGSTRTQFQTMLQDLLVQRFHLAAHRESRDFPAFELVVSKGGPKFKESKTAAPAESGSTLNGGSGAPAPLPLDRDGFPMLPPGPHTGQVLVDGNERLRFQERSMQYLAGLLGALIRRSMGPEAWPKQPTVEDKTGLTGSYDFTLEFACLSCVAASRVSGASSSTDALPMHGPTIFEALDRQLGLKAVRIRDTPLEVLVVDHMDKAPTPQ